MGHPLHHLFGGHDHGFGGRGGFGRGGRGGGFMGGSGMRAVKMLASGDLQLVVLSLLAEKPRHGYEIIKALEEHSSGVYTPSPGMVYPALTYVEEMGYASASTEGTKKLYTITDEGKTYLGQNRAAADETLGHLARFGRKLSRFQKAYSEDETAADEFGKLKAEFHELRDELKSALRAKFDATVEEKKRVLGVLRRAITEIRGK